MTTPSDIRILGNGEKITYKEALAELAKLGPEWRLETPHELFALRSPLTHENGNGAHSHDETIKPDWYWTSEETPWYEGGRVVVGFLNGLVSYDDFGAGRAFARAVRITTDEQTAAAVGLPEPAINTVNHASIRVIGFSDEQLVVYAEARVAAAVSPLERELEALRKDAERLNWMDANRFAAYRPIAPIGGPSDLCAIVHETMKPPRWNVANGIREAIDDAIAAQRRGVWDEHHS